MNWGFYCRTCGVSSRAWFDDPVKAMQTYLAILPKIDALTRDEDVTLPTVQIPVIVFLSSHSGHDLWAECESGVFHLNAGRRPDRNVVPPQFASNQGLAIGHPSCGSGRGSAGFGSESPGPSRAGAAPSA